MLAVFRTQSYLLAICLAVVAPPLASAALVLDDFDDLAITASPEMEEIFVTTPNVGVLSAERRMRVIGSATEPVADLDSNASNASALTADLAALNPRPVGLPLFAFQFKYAFSPFDVSESGTNNAIIFDFKSVQGNGYVPELGVIVRDDFDLSETYFAAIRDLPASSGPFSAHILFSSFTQRGGSPGLPDFTTIKQMDFDFFFQFPPSDAQWSAQVERIRFGRVPEPDSMVLLIFGACAALAKVMRRFFPRRSRRCLDHPYLVRSFWPAVLPSVWRSPSSAVRKAAQMRRPWSGR